MTARALQPLADPVRHPRHLEHVLGGAVRVVEGAAVVVGRLHQARSEKPPSTISVWPRIISAAGEQRNATASAMSSGRTSRPAGLSRAEAEHLVLVREVLERAGVDDAARDAVGADPARGQLDGEVADQRLERGLRGADERVVLEHALRAEARDPDDRGARRICGATDAGQRQQRAGVRGHRPVPVLVLGLERGPDHAGGGVVDEHVERRRARRPPRARGRRRCCRGPAPARRRAPRSSSAVSSAAWSERR